MEMKNIEAFYRETRVCTWTETIETIERIIGDYLQLRGPSNQVKVEQVGAKVFKVSCSYNSKDVESLSYALEIRDLIQRGKDDHTRNDESFERRASRHSP